MFTQTLQSIYSHCNSCLNLEGHNLEKLEVFKISTDHSSTINDVINKQSQNL